MLDCLICKVRKCEQSQEELECIATSLVVLNHYQKTKLEENVTNTETTAVLGDERRSAHSLASLALAYGEQTVNQRGRWRYNERD